jgi:hypothetical protein
MPIEINKGETEDQFVSRCIGEEVSSGKENDQAVAICYSKWREEHKMSSQEMFISQMNQYRKRMTYWFAEGEDPCTAGYTQYGMKDGDDGRPVPNCIPDEKED